MIIIALGSRLLGVYRLNSVCEQQLVHNGAAVWIVKHFIDLIHQMLCVTSALFKPRLPFLTVYSQIKSCSLPPETILIFQFPGERLGTLSHFLKAFSLKCRTPEPAFITSS